MPTRITFDITQTDYKLDPNEEYTISFENGFMIDDGDTANQNLDFITFTTSPVLITATIGSYTPNEKSLFFAFNKNVSYNTGSIYIYAEDSTLAREIDNTTLSTVDTDSNNIEIPIPFPAEALEDNAKYFIVLDDDLFLSNDRVLTKYNSWTNNRVDLEFTTGTEGLDEFVAFLDASQSSLTINATNIKQFEASLAVNTDIMCYPYKAKAFNLSSYTYQQTFANPTLQNHEYLGFTVAASDQPWYMEHINVQKSDQTSGTNKISFTNLNYSDQKRDQMRSLTVIDYFDHETKTYFPNSQVSGYSLSYVFGIWYDGYPNSSTHQFGDADVKYTPSSGSVGGNTILRTNWLNPTLDQWSVADGFGVNIAITRPTANSNRGVIELYKNFNTTPITIYNQVDTGGPVTGFPYFGRAISISHKYVAVWDYNQNSAVTTKSNVQIFDLSGNHVRTIDFGNQTYNEGQIALMKHTDTEDYICVGNTIYDITTGNLHQTLSITGLSLSNLRLDASETRLAIATLGNTQTVNLFDTTTNSFSSLGSASNPNTQTHDTLDQYGRGLSISENQLVVGAKEEDQTNPANNLRQVDTGTIYVYT